MAIGIYYFKNKINGKYYIGQSVDLRRRYRQHRLRWNNLEYGFQNTKLYKAFRKYGFEQFEYGILEECLKTELDKKERDYIKKFNSFFEGYNETLGGASSLKTETDSIIIAFKELELGKLNYQEIADLTGLSTRSIYSINVGETWKRDIEYPINKYISWTGSNEEVKKRIQKEEERLRKKGVEKEKTSRINASTKNFCVDCGVQIYKTSQRCNICVGKLQRKVEWPEPIVLAEEIVKNGFSATGWKYGVTDNTIKKWCVSYGMGKLKHEVAMWYEKNK